MDWEFGHLNKLKQKKEFVIPEGKALVSKTRLRELEYENEKLKIYIMKVTGVIKLTQYDRVVKINSEMRKHISTQDNIIEHYKERINDLLGIDEQEVVLTIKTKSREL